MIAKTFLLLVSCCLYGSKADHLRGRHAEFQKIGKYETLHFDPVEIESKRMFEFDAFGQHYQIALQRNKHHVPAHMQPVNVDPLEHTDEPHFTSFKESCHFLGTVLNKDDDDAQSTLVSITMCPKRGIRAHIRAFNETLFIYPSAYYLDHSREFYSFDEEHIAWRVSDLELDPNQPFPQPEGAAVPEEMTQSVEQQLEQRLRAKDPERRRLAYNNGENVVEVYLVSGPVRSQTYKDDHGGVWFEQLMADYYDIFGAVTATYLGTDWGSNIGDIEIKISQVEVLFNYEDARYDTLAPRFYYSNALQLGCTTAPGLSLVENCRINSDAFADQLKSWATEQTDPSQYDVLHFVMDVPPKPENAGKAWFNGICSLGGYGTGYSSSYGSASDWFRKVIAHELAHNFNIAHDGEGNDCLSTSANIMASGTAGFSSCSIAYMQQRFEDTDGLACLGDGLRSFVSNANNDGIIPTPKPTMRPTTSCYTVSGLENVISGSTWDWGGTYYHAGTTGNGWPYFKKSTADRFIYFGTDHGEYCVSDNFATGECGAHNARCINNPSYDFETCTTWVIYNWGHGGWDTVNNVAVNDCGSGSSGGGTTPTTTTTTTTTATPKPTSKPTSASGSVTSVSECVTITSLSQGWDGIDYNGRWEASGTLNGQPLYTKDGLANRYLCYSSSLKRWLLSSDSECPWVLDMYGFCYQDTLTDCNDYWAYRMSESHSYYIDQSVTFSYCDAFIFDSCLETTGLEENVCMSSNQTDSLWKDATTFTSYETMRCRNDRPVYHYTVYNDSVTDPDDAGYIVERWFLHYWQFHGFAKWLITRNEIGDINIVAECSASSLLDCNDGGWTVLHSTYDSSQMTTEPSMTVDNYECGYVAAEMTDDGAKNAIIYVVVALIALVVIVVAAFLVYRCVSKKREQPPQQDIGTIGEDEQKGYDMQQLNETQEIEVEAEVEVPITTN